MLHNIIDILSLPWIEKKKSSGILSISSGTLLCIDEYNGFLTWINTWSSQSIKIGIDKNLSAQSSDFYRLITEIGENR